MDIYFSSFHGIRNIAFIPINLDINENVNIITWNLNIKVIYNNIKCALLLKNELNLLEKRRVKWTRKSRKKHQQIKGSGLQQTHKGMLKFIRFNRILNADTFQPNSALMNQVKFEKSRVRNLTGRHYTKLVIQCRTSQMQMRIMNIHTRITAMKG